MDKLRDKLPQEENISRKEIITKWGIPERTADARIKRFIESGQLTYAEYGTYRVTPINDNTFNADPAKSAESLSLINNDIQNSIIMNKNLKKTIMSKYQFNPINKNVYKKLPTLLAKLMEVWETSHQKDVILLTVLKEIGIFYPDITTFYSKLTLNSSLGIDFDENDKLSTIGREFAKLAINRTEGSLNTFLPFLTSTDEEDKQIELRLKKENPNHSKYIERYIEIIIGNRLYDFYSLLHFNKIQIVFDSDQINNMEKYWHQVYSTPHYLRNVFSGNEREAMLMTMKIAMILTIFRIEDSEKEIKPFYYASKKDFLNARDIATVAIRHSRVLNPPAEIKIPQRNLFHENMIKSIPIDRELTRLDLNRLWRMPITTSDYIIKELVDHSYLIRSDYGLTYSINSLVMISA